MRSLSFTIEIEYIVSIESYSKSIWCVSITSYVNETELTNEVMILMKKTAGVVNLLSRGSLRASRL